MPTNYEPLLPPQIDDRSEAQIVEGAIAAVYRASGGTLNDFRAGSPARALIEGQAYAGAELAWRVNQLGEAIAIRFLQIAGIQRRLGSAARAILQVQLTEPQSVPFTLPQGYPVYTSGSRLRFEFESALLIPPGEVVGEVVVAGAQPGTMGNVPANTITDFIQSLAFVARAFNPSAATGGTDPETDEEAKIRGFQALRRRDSLFSVADYESAVRAELGDRAPVRVFPGLDQNPTLRLPGAIHVFVLAQDGSELGEAQLLDLRAKLRSRSALGVAERTFISNLAPMDIGLRAIVRLAAGRDPGAVAQDIYQRLATYLRPDLFQLESLLRNELEYRARLADGVEYVASVETRGGDGTLYAAQDLPLDWPWSVPRLQQVVVEVLNGRGDPFVYFFGEPFPSDIDGNAP